MSKDKKQQLQNLRELIIGEIKRDHLSQMYPGLPIQMQEVIEGLVARDLELKKVIDNHNRSLLDKRGKYDRETEAKTIVNKYAGHSKTISREERIAEEEAREMLNLAIGKGKLQDKDHKSSQEQPQVPSIKVMAKLRTLHSKTMSTVERIVEEAAREMLNLAIGKVKLQDKDHKSSQEQPQVPSIKVIAKLQTLMSKKVVLGINNDEIRNIVMNYIAAQDHQEKKEAELTKCIEKATQLVQNEIAAEVEKKAKKDAQHQAGKAYKKEQPRLAASQKEAMAERVKLADTLMHEMEAQCKKVLIDNKAKVTSGMDVVKEATGLTKQERRDMISDFIKTSTLIVYDEVSKTHKVSYPKDFIKGLVSQKAEEKKTPEKRDLLAKDLLQIVKDGGPHGYYTQLFSMMEANQGLALKAQKTLSEVAKKIPAKYFAASQSDQRELQKAILEKLSQEVRLHSQFPDTEKFIDNVANVQFIDTVLNKKKQAIASQKKENLVQENVLDDDNSLRSQIMQLREEGKLHRKGMEHYTINHIPLLQNYISLSQQLERQGQALSSITGAGANLSSIKDAQYMLDILFSAESKFLSGKEGQEKLSSGLTVKQDYALKALTEHLKDPEHSAKKSLHSTIMREFLQGALGNKELHHTLEAMKRKGTHPGISDQLLDNMIMLADPLLHQGNMEKLSSQFKKESEEAQVQFNKMHQALESGNQKEAKAQSRKINKADIEKKLKTYTAILHKLNNSKKALNTLDERSKAYKFNLETELKNIENLYEETNKIIEVLSQLVLQQEAAASIKLPSLLEKGTGFVTKGAKQVVDTVKKKIMTQFNDQVQGLTPVLEKAIQQSEQVSNKQSKSFVQQGKDFLKKGAEQIVETAKKGVKSIQEMPKNAASILTTKKRQKSNIIIEAETIDSTFNKEKPQVGGAVRSPSPNLSSEVTSHRDDAQSPKQPHKKRKLDYSYVSSIYQDMDRDEKSSKSKSRQGNLTSSPRNNKGHKQKSQGHKR
jgi:hypothetical protein